MSRTRARRRRGRSCACDRESSGTSAPPPGSAVANSIKLTVAQVEGWPRREALSGGKGGKPQARASCRDDQQMLGEMLEWAIARRYITGNPARIAKLPKDRSATDPDAPSVYKQSKAKESFTREQYVSLMAVLTSTDDDEFRIATPNAYFVALLSIGARPGEIDDLR